MEVKVKRIETSLSGLSSGTLCAQCGYRFVRGERVLRVHDTGDFIHDGCLVDYVDDNLSEICDEFEA